MKPSHKPTPATSKTEEFPLHLSIHKAGWRQGSVMHRKDVARLLSDQDIQLPDGEHLVICTQSCSIVGPNFDRDPNVELARAKQLPVFNPKADTAVGKVVDRFDAELETNSICQALQLNINNRVLLQRKLLSAITPNTELILKNPSGMANWIGRYYSRVAMPTGLVNEMRAKDGVYDQVKVWLKSDLNGSPLNEAISAIYINWTPGDEVGPYRLELFFMADNDEAVESFDLNLRDKLLDYQSVHLQVADVDCKTKETTFVSELDGKERFSEYDYLTGMEELGGMLNK